MEPISDEQVKQLLPVLAEAARADKNTAARFVPPRIGILEETASQRHQFVFGRRGVGKSTLLRKIESLGPGSTHGAVIFVDVETLGGRPYPDVLIELLIELLDPLSVRMKPSGLDALKPGRGQSNVASTHPKSEGSCHHASPPASGSQSRKSGGINKT